MQRAVQVVALSRSDAQYMQQHLQQPGAQAAVKVSCWGDQSCRCLHTTQQPCQMHVLSCRCLRLTHCQS